MRVYILQINFLPSEFFESRNITSNNGKLLSFRPVPHRPNHFILPLTSFSSVRLACRPDSRAVKIKKFGQKRGGCDRAMEGHQSSTAGKNGESSIMTTIEFSRIVRGPEFL